MLWVPIAIVASLIACCLLSVLSERQSLAEIEPQPSVSDEEFCELLPEVPREVSMKVRSVMVDVSGWDREEIHPNTRIIELELC